MNKEVKQLIDYLQEFANDDRKEKTKYGVEISQDDTKLLLTCIEQLQQENEEKAKTYAKIRDEICDYLDSHRFCENFENVGNEENVRKEILGILLKRWQR